MEVAIHVEANNAKVIRAGYIWDEAFTSFPLFWHAHPHVPVPKLREESRQNTTQRRRLFQRAAYFAAAPISICTI